MKDSRKSDKGRPQPTRARKKRSLWERCLVWGGISALLIVVLVEWITKKSYQDTLARLETASQERDETGVRKPLSLDEAKTRVRGFPSLREEGKDPNRRIIYTWKSLFKTFTVVLNVNNDHVINIDTQTDYEDSFKKGTRPDNLNQQNSSLDIAYQLKMPKVTTSDDILQLPKQQEEGTPSNAESRYGTLVRELVRQAVLVTARNELGLTTRDGSFSEVTLVEEGNPRFPLQVVLALQSFDPEKPTCNIKISRTQPDGKVFRWEKSVLFEQSNLEDLITKLEELSRGEFVTALQDSGFKRITHATSGTPRDKPAQIPQMDVVSQFAELKRLHSECRSNGESDEVLEGLIRTYANLGDLTNFYWSSMSKSFSARALIYAQRYVAKKGGSATTLAYRAYARGLAGRHATALDDVKAAKEFVLQSPPGWLELIKAYCAYEPDVLSKRKGDDQELSSYLLMRASREIGSTKRLSAAVDRVLRINPASFRAYAALCETNSLGLLRTATERGFDLAWRGIYEQFRYVTDLPDNIRQIVDNQRSNRDADEYESRIGLIKSLRKAGASIDDQSEPSWNMLADLLEEATFAQATEVMRVEKFVLSVSCENSIKRLRPLVQTHRWKKYIETFSDDRQVGSANMLEVARDVAQNYEPQMFNLAIAVHPIAGPGAYGYFYQKMFFNSDLIYEDLLNEHLFTSSPHDFYAQEWRKVSPHQPTVVTYSIQKDWDHVKDLAEGWQTTYAKSPTVMIALGKQFSNLGQYDAAIRCLEKSIDAEPSFDAYEELANVYHSQGDLIAYQETLEDALDLPDFGLQKAQVQSKLASLKMRKGKWQEARPFAMQAAATYSGWGLILGSRCAEGLGDWKNAEMLQRAASERYDNAATDWYFWCIRTGRGDINSARRFAESYWQKFVPPLNTEQIDSLFYRYLIDGKNQQALEMVRTMKITPAGPGDSINLDLEPQSVVHGALVADELKETDFRDRLLKILPQLEKRRGRTQLINLANLFQKALKDSEKVEWDENAFDDMLIRAYYDDVTFLYFAAGKFLTQHNQQELGRRYLQLAATSYRVEDWSCMLAALLLRQQGVAVGESRLSELEPDLAKVSELLTSAKREMRRGKYDAAEQRFNDALSLRPKLVATLTEIAEFYVDRGNYVAALKTFEQAVQANLNSCTARNGIAWFLATCPDATIRNGETAVKHAEISNDLSPIKSYLTLTTTAAAFAEANQFEKAVALEKQAVQLVSDTPKRYERLQLYLKNNPYRTPEKTEANDEPAVQK